MAQKDSDKIKTTPAEGKIAASVLDAVLEFCETNGHQPNPESMLGTLYAAIYAYDHSKRYYDKNENDEMYADKLHRARAFTSYGRKKIRDAGKEISIRKAEKNAVGIERVFPRAKLVRVIFGEPAYQHITAQKNDMAAKIFAEYFDRVLNENFSKRDIEFLELGVGIGVTDYMRKELEKPAFVQKTQAYRMGYFAEGLHPRAIADAYLLTESRVRQIQNWSIRKLQNDQELERFFNLYQNGDIDGMLALLPPPQQRAYKFQQENKMAEIPTDDANKVGEWLADNFKLQR